MRKSLALLLLAFFVSSCSKPHVTTPRVTVEGDGEYSIYFIVFCPDLPFFSKPLVAAEGHSTTMRAIIDSMGGSYYDVWVHGYLHDPCDSAVVPITIVCEKDTMVISVTVPSSGIQATAVSNVHADPNTGLFTYDLEIGCCDKENGTYTITFDMPWNVSGLRATPATVSCPGPGGIQHVSIVGKLEDLTRNGAVPILIKGPHGDVHEFTFVPKVR